MEQLHDTLQEVGAERMAKAFRAALQAQSYEVRFVAQCLGWNGSRETRNSPAEASA